MNYSLFNELGNLGIYNSVPGDVDQLSGVISI